MFDEMVESRKNGRSRARRWIYPISLLIHVLVVVAIVGASYLVVEAVKEPRGELSVFVATPPSPPPPPPPPPPAGSSATPDTVRVPEIEPEPFVQPEPTPVEPPEIEPVDPAGSGSDGVIGGDPHGVPGGDPHGVPGGDPYGVPGAMGLEPIVPTPDMVEPKLIQKITPDYPELARMARMKGRVILQAVIDVHGNVGEVTVLKSSNGMFDQAAIAAVQKWKYTPAQRDGRPVAVYFTIVVEFELN